jgi:hypothetical protein
MRKKFPLRDSTSHWVRATAFVAILQLLIVAAGTSGLTQSASEVTPLTVTTSFGTAPLAADARVELHLSRPLVPSEGALAIFIGETDMTGLFVTSGTKLGYTPNLLPLPLGETTVTVYLISPANQWEQIATFPLRVGANEPPAGTAAAMPSVTGSSAASSQSTTDGKRKPWGWDRFEWKPSLTLSFKAESAVLYYPDNNRPQRLNFIDVTLQGSLQSNLARGRFKSESQFDFVGSSYQRDALRFGNNGDDAPQFDLSSYVTNLELSKVKFRLGHNSFGTNRYLINSFSSRGLTLTVPFGSRADFALTAMNGTSVVGWNNFTGLGQRKHKVIAGTFGFEFLPKRPGGIRVEAGLLRGSLLPISNFNQSNLTDAERSNGFGFRIVASDAEGRLRLEAGFGRSRFGNPTDPLLNQGFTVVPVREEGKNARYLDFSYQLLKSWTPIKDRPINLSFAFRHNRVDPLFRSTALYAQADRNDNQAELTGSVGEINFGASHNRSNDNLDDILSILQTLTRRSGFQVGGPLTALLGAKQVYSKWLPRVSYNYELTHAYGAFLPTGGGFSESHVPDQSSTNQTGNVEWSQSKWRFSYRLNESFQDNRQPGRDRADFRTLSHTFGTGFTPGQRFNINLDLSSERSTTLETAQVDKNFRAGVNFNIQTTKKSTLAATISSAFGGDNGNRRSSRNADLDVQWSMRFGIYEKERWKKVQGQFFARYANRYASARDNIFFFNNLTKIQTVSAGLSFTFF